MVNENESDWVSVLEAIEAREAKGSSFQVLWMLLHARVFTDPEGSGFRTLGVVERTIWIANVFISEVLNGGFHQFFSNSSGNHADELPDVLKRVGATRMLELFRRAESVCFPVGGTPLLRKLRWRFLRRSSKRVASALDEIDKKFYALGASDQPDLLGYAFANPDALVFTKDEMREALDHCPAFLFPADRKTTARFDMDECQVRIASEQTSRSFPLRDVETLHIAKVQRAPGASGLVYRFKLAAETVDVPYFSRGESASGSVFWYFPNVMANRRLVGRADVLAEIRRDGALDPVLLWSRDEGSRYLK